MSRSYFLVILRVLIVPVPALFICMCSYFEILGEIAMISGCQRDYDEILG